MWLMMRGGREGPSSASDDGEQHRRIAALERELVELRGALERDAIGAAVAQCSASRTFVDI